MAYERQNFENGQKLYCEHLNHIEDGLCDLDTKIGELDQYSDNLSKDILLVQQEMQSQGDDVTQLQKDVTANSETLSRLENISQDQTEMIDDLNADTAFLMDKSQDHDQVMNDHKIRLNFAEQDIERVDTEITKLKEGDPKPVTIDFSNFDNGSFTVSYEDGTVSNHTVTFDAAGNPVSIDDMTIVWGAE